MTGMCPTCSSSQPHYHPHHNLCPDAWHSPTPSTDAEWRGEVTRWAGLLEQWADVGQPGGVDSIRRIAVDMRREAGAENTPLPPASEEGR